MTDDTKPDHEEARRLAEGLILIGHSAEPKYSNLAEAYLASQAENAELRQLVGGEFLEASKDKALTEARSDRDALHRALGEVCGWLESRDPKPQLHAAESLQNARALLKSTRVLTTPGEGT